jgi:hypothetical protein
VSQNEAYAAVTPGFGGAGVILKFNGSTWSKQYEFTGLGTELFYGIHFPSAARGCAVGVGGMIKTLNTGATAVDDVSASGMVPYEFTLSQNFPNPFNPTTTIAYTLAFDGPVTLSVYDLMGQEMATLVNEVQSAGIIRQATFDASRLPSGIYIARLVSGERSMLRRMVLVK